MYARKPTSPRPRRSQTVKFNAPVAGWISNRALSDPNSLPGPGAIVLDNFFPKASSVVLRRGQAKYATIGTGPVGSMFAYNNGTDEHLFAADENSIFDITSVSGPTDDGTEVVTGLAGADWVVVQFATTGGVFLIGVNGADDGFSFDGTTYGDLSGITFPGGRTAADMAFVWVYKNRLWFAEKDALNAYYMDNVDAVLGAATQFPLAGVLGLGGYLMFGQGWSLSSSTQFSLSEQLAFVSSEGEVAIYQGADPTDTVNWLGIGTYRIGRPLGRRAFFHGGGDLAIATSVGLVPLSKAIELDVTSLNVATVSYNIADGWSEALALRDGREWSCQLWPEQKMAVVSPPLSADINPVLFVANSETGAWCRYTGWDVRSSVVFQGLLYFGGENGKIYLANTGGDDDDLPYTGTLMPLFDDLGSPANLKLPKLARVVGRATVPMNGKVTFAADFNTQTPAVPDAELVGDVALWGTGVWGTSLWGSVGQLVVTQGWRSIGGSGYACSLIFQVTSADNGPLDAEVIRMEMVYDQAEIVT
jgi:hypothetical protein